jgi:hypothetical protein
LRRQTQLTNLFAAVVLAISVILSAGRPERIEAGAAKVRISQVYAGSQDEAVYRNDFVELLNPTNVDIALEGWSLQYAGATDETWQVTPLSGTIHANSYYLIEQGGHDFPGPALPAPDVAGIILLNNNKGKLALVRSTTPLSGLCPKENNIVDFLSYGAVQCAEGDAPAPAISTALALVRREGGCQDTDDNSKDFYTGTPLAHNTGSPHIICGAVGDDPPRVVLTIPQDGAINQAPLTHLTLVFSEPVTMHGNWFEIQCQQSGAHSADPASLDDTHYTLNLSEGILAEDDCVVKLDAAAILDKDGIADRLVNVIGWQFKTVPSEMPSFEAGVLKDTDFLRTAGVFEPLPFVSAGEAISELSLASPWVHPMSAMIPLTGQLPTLVNSSAGNLGWGPVTTSLDTQNDRTSPWLIIYNPAAQAAGRHLFNHLDLNRPILSAKPFRNQILLK